MCVCELQTALGTAQSTTSKHLKILEDAGLAASHKDGLWVNYTLADGRQSAYAASILGNLRHLAERCGRDQRPDGRHRRDRSLPDPEQKLIFFVLII